MTIYKDNNNNSNNINEVQIIKKYLQYEKLKESKSISYSCEGKRWN